MSARINRIAKLQHSAEEVGSRFPGGNFRVGHHSPVMLRPARIRLPHTRVILNEVKNLP